jgi:hypothetical protein
MRAPVLLALLLILAAGSVVAEDTTNATAGTVELGVLPHETVEFDGHTLVLAWQNTTDVEQVKEYIPLGQKLNHWTMLASIRQFPALADVKQVVGAMVNQLKKQYPQSPMAILEQPESGDVIIDFVVWPPDASFVEFNVFRYQKNPQGGLVAEQYALREYQNPEAFLKGLRPLRERLVNLMASEGLQFVSADKPDETADESAVEPSDD